MIKKIYTIIVLICNLIVRRKDYTLKFIALNDGPIKRWYYVFPHWGFDFNHLEMVAGADKLCELYSNGTDEATVEIKATKEQDDTLKDKGYKCFVKQEVSKELDEEELSLLEKILYGRTYIHWGTDKKITTFWICPVTLFVLGRYPRYIYIKDNNG